MAYEILEESLELEGDPLTVARYISEVYEEWRETHKNIRIDKDDQYYTPYANEEYPSTRYNLVGERR